MEVTDVRERKTLQIYLNPFEEFVGIYQEIIVGETGALIHFEGYLLTLPNHQVKDLEKVLRNVPKGSRIGVLKISNDLLRVRMLDG